MDEKTPFNVPLRATTDITPVEYIDTSGNKQKWGDPRHMDKAYISEVPYIIKSVYHAARVALWTTGKLKRLYNGPLAVECQPAIFIIGHIILLQEQKECNLIYFVCHCHNKSLNR
jgi:hypothetical protein